MINAIYYKIFMPDEKYFLYPVHEWQRRYEALRASFVDRLPANAVADRFGYSANYVYLLRHQFDKGIPVANTRSVHTLPRVLFMFIDIIKVDF